MARLATIRPIRVAAAAFGLAALAFGGCAQSPQQIAATTSHGKEYFPESTYGRASRRVVADGQPVPRGGGQYLVGKPYTVAGQTYYPSERRVMQVGNASWYGDAFHGRLTANGEIYDRDAFTAAHPTMPLPSYARVTNLRNNASMIVRVNDRGPYASNRVMDVSRRVAEALDFKRYGTAKVKVEYVGHASLAGSDDARLFATLTQGAPARWQGEPTMVAEAQPLPRVAAAYAPVEPALVERMPPPRRRVIAAREPEPEPRRVEVASIVREARQDFGRRESGREEAGREFGRHNFGRQERAHLPSARQIERPDAVETAYRRYSVARDEPAPRSRLAARDTASHLPIHDLLPPPRFDRAERAHPGLLPPPRPSEIASHAPPRRRIIEARATRWRDD